jgi:hypothetical protein
MKRLIQKIIRLERPGLVQDELIEYYEEVNDNDPKSTVSEKLENGSSKDG